MVNGKSRQGSVLAALPATCDGAHAFFSNALEGLSLCEDVAVAAGSSAARAYVAGAAGSLRHALEILLAERGVASHADEIVEFETHRIGTSELIGGSAGWDTALRCTLPDATEATVRALWPTLDPLSGVWLRPDATLPGLWMRGRIEVDKAALRFVDEPERDARPVPQAAQDLGRDLIALKLKTLARTPALSAALELSLISGSWCHVSTGTRWFADDATARSIVRIMGGALPIAPTAMSRLRGVVDREALLLIERAGWRHIPTPGIAH